MANIFNPQMLIFPSSGGIENVQFTSDTPGTGQWTSLISPSDGLINDAAITNKTTSGCTITVRANSNSTNLDKEYTITIGKGTLTQPIYYSFKAISSSKLSGYVPSSNAITVPISGGTYNIYQLYSSDVTDYENVEVTVSDGKEICTIQDIIKLPNAVYFSAVFSYNNFYYSNKTVTLQIKRGGITQNYFILASGNVNISKKITATPNPITVSSSAKTDIEIDVVSNFNNSGAFTISDINGDFISNIRATSQTLNKCTIKFDVTNNTQEIVRTGSFKINFGGISETITVNQEKYIPKSGTIILSKNYLQVSSNEISGRFNISTKNINGLLTLENNNNWVSAILTQENIIFCTYQISANTTNSIRNGVLKISGVDETNKTVSATFTIVQNADNTFQIWKNIEYTYPSKLSYLNYSVQNDGNLIYNGRIYKLPNEDNFVLPISNICNNYLENKIDNLDNYKNNLTLLSNNNYYKTFDVLIDGNIVNSYNFYSDYSYDNYNVKNTVSEYGYLTLSKYIRNQIDRRQYFLYSFINLYAETAYLNYYLNGKNGFLQREKYQISDRYLHTICDNSLEAFKQYNEISINQSEKFKIVDTCAEYCLYYKNLYGGYDSFLIFGNSKKIDEIESQYFNKYANNLSLNFEKNKYLNKIITTYELYTDFLTDAESKKMNNLFESTSILLHNLNTNEITPVIITNTEYEYKTFKTNGNKLTNYNITLESSQEKVIY